MQLINSYWLSANDKPIPTTLLHLSLTLENKNQLNTFLSPALINHIRMEGNGMGQTSRPVRKMDMVEYHAH